MPARRSGPVVFLVAAALPVVLWHRVVADIASEFRLGAAYLVSGWTCSVLMALGLACLIPPAIADHRHRHGRFSTRGTGAWYGWGITLYLLGVALATEVAQIADGLSAL
jgi:hypothetical protein